MQLQDLITGIPIGRVDETPDGDPVVTDLTDDSRAVTPGALFIGRQGAGADVRSYIAMAVERGAVAVLVRADSAGVLAEFSSQVPGLVAEPGVAVDQRLAGRLAERFFGEPASKLTLVGITGTNGKTTTATIAQHLLRAAGRTPGLLGTVHLDTGHPDGPRPAELTTPGAIELTRLLAEMVNNGCDSAVMEVSSHALHQGRADHLRFAAAGFTNFTQDHLDYHGTMEHYADAKALLFESLDEDATAVLNGDDPAAERMARGCKASIVRTHVAAEPGSQDDRGSHATGTATATAVELAASHCRALFVGPWGDLETRLPLVGPHNLANAIQAAALAYAVTGMDTDGLRTALDACPPVPGRLEPVGPDWPKGQDRGARIEGRDAGNQSRSSPPDPRSSPTVLVDYAHTPDALINVTSALRPLTPPPGRLIVVFGCGGDRDRDKRPLMAQAACQYADLAVLTSDNPRTEDPKQILDDAAAGFRGELRTETHTEIDRAAAIRYAIDQARPGDTVLIAGKGHEDYQIVGKTKHHFDDREHAAAALRDYSASPMAPSS